MTENELLLAGISDKMRSCEYNNMITNTNFLDIYQQSTALKMLSTKRCRFEMLGGFEDGERKIIVFLPDYVESTEAYFAENPNDNPLAAMRIEKDSFSELSHRDYLGAIMGLGIKREMLGDLMVDKKGCTVAIIKNIEKYITDNLISVGKGSVKIIHCKDFSLGQQEDIFESKRCYVSSMRADAVVSAAFSISRSSAAEKIKRGAVLLNGMIIAKPDAHIEFNSKIVIHGSGKVIIDEDAGITKKGRQAFIVKKYG